MSEALFFLIDTVFGLVLSVFVLRAMLAFAGASHLHPISQAIDKLTRPVVLPLRRVIPNTGRIEWASLLVILVLECLQLVILSLLMGSPLSPGFILFYALRNTVRLILKAYFFAVIAEVILTWVQPFSPATLLLEELVDPLMRPVRRLIPPLGNIDLTPIPVIIVLQFLLILLP